MIQTAHCRFIFKPVGAFLADAVGACYALNNGIDIYPACEYLFQSSLLRMTGAQEQKLRCICWDISTYDYDFRYEYMKNVGGLGEFSSYDSKKAVFGMLCGKKKVEFSNEWKSATIAEVNKELDEIVSNSIFCDWNPRMIADYTSCISLLKHDKFCNDGQLLLGCLYNIYDFLYKERNRFAHNLYSYQENLPALKLLSDKDALYHNYYMWFAVLMLLDRIFIYLYEVNMNRIASLE